MKSVLLSLALLGVISCAQPSTAAPKPCLVATHASGPTGVPTVDAVIALLLAQGYSACDVAHVVTNSEAVTSDQLAIKLILQSFGITSPVPYIEPVDCPDLP